MQVTRVVGLLAALLLAAAPRLARAQCSLNAAGGPSELILTSQDAGSDIDLGWRGTEADNLPFPAGSEMRLCLSGCDDTTDPVCDANGAAVTVAGQTLAPPVPFMAGSVTGVCLVVRFTTPPSGTANVETGAIDVSASLTAAAHVAFFPTATTKICPRCSGATVGASGTCDSGDRVGQACVVDDVITVPDAPAGADTIYNVSRDCAPSTTPAGTTALDLSLTTDVASLTGSLPCGGQTSSNNCGAGTCTGTCPAEANQGGVLDACCVNALSQQPCFPNPIERLGSASSPLPTWPGTAYPKSGTGLLADALCVPVTGSPSIDPIVGLPGPLALRIPIVHDWYLTPITGTTTTTPTTTSTSSTVATTTSVPVTTTSAPVTTTTGVLVTTTSVAGTTTTTTTLPPGSCTSPANCDDGDPCTENLCSAGTCSNPLLSGTDGAQCAIEQLPAPSSLCGPETIHPKMLGTLTNKLDQTTRLLDKAENAPTAKKRAKLLKKARAALQLILRKAEKFGGNGKLSTECAGTISEAITAVQQTVPSG